MKETIINLFLNEQLNLNQISKRVNLSKEEVDKYLKSEHYVLNSQRTYSHTVLIKKAIDEYLSLNKKIGATSIAKKYGISHSTLIDCMHKLNIEVPNNQNRTKFDNTVFDVIDTEEKAYWLGFIYADGYIDSSPLKPDIKNRYQFEISLSDKDTSHLHKFNKFMKHESDNVKVDKVRCGETVYGRCRWSVVNKHLWEQLNELGVHPNKSLTLTFPQESIFKDNSLIKHFIRGYFDGDGSVGLYPTKYKTPRYTCSVLGTKDFLEKVLHYSKVDAKFEHDKRHSKETFHFQLSATRTKKFLDYLYKDCTIYLDRKFDKYLEICRSWEKFHELLEDENGELCDGNTVLNSEIAKGSESV